MHALMDNIIFATTICADFQLYAKVTCKDEKKLGVVESTVAFKKERKSNFFRNI